ncbi:hypothetical protein ACWGST_13090 [Agromyces sp. NPDC055520]
MKRNALAIAIALAALTALSACVPGGAPSSSPSPSAASPAPSTPPPTPEAPVAASIAFSAEVITVLGADGTALASFDYFQPTAEVVAGLRTYLGAPVDTPNAGGIETPSGIDHVWGDLRLFDTETDPPGGAPENPNHYVFVSGPSAGALPIATVAGVGAATGVRVGDPATALTIGVETSPPYTDPTSGRTSVISRIGIVALPPRPEAPTEPRNLAVMVVSFTDTGLIERLVAPSANFGV